MIERLDPTPAAGLMGALKVRDEVEIVIDAQLPLG
jgi:hypothetical protein